MADEYTGKELVERYSQGMQAHRLWEPHWQSIADHLLPRKATINTVRTRGEKAHKDRFSSAPMHYHEVLAANLQGTLTSRSFRWFDLILSNNDELNKDPEMKGWLQDSSKRMWSAINQSNFHSHSHEFYIDLTGFGTANIVVQAKPGPRRWNGLKFRTFPIQEYIFEEDEDGQPNAVCMFYNWTARQIRSQFPNATLSNSVTKAFKTDPNRKFMFLHWVIPRYESDPSKKDKMNMPFGSYWVDHQSEIIVEEGGFEEFPAMPTRWSRNSGEVYGRGPGSTALADIKVLNKATELALDSWAKNLDPPWFVLDDGVVGKVDLRPGKGTVVRDRDALWFYESRGRPGVDQIKFEDLRNSIKMTFFADQLELPQSDRMTAEEIRTRVELMQRVLGPTLGRLETEYLNPLVMRIFNIMFRAGAFAEPPQIVIDAFNAGETELEVKYSGPLARAERLTEVFSIQRLYDSMAGPAQVDPSVMDIINNDEAARVIAFNQDVPESIIRTPEEIQAIRESRAEQQQMQQQMELGLAQSQIAESSAKVRSIDAEIG